MRTQKNKIKILYTSSLVSLFIANISSSFAESVQVQVVPQSAPCPCPVKVDTSERRAFVQIRSGASFSQNSRIKTNPAIWDPSPNGYNSKLGTAPIIGAGFGYLFTPFLSGIVSIDHRWNYKYRKFQNTPPSPGTPFALPSKTRKFDLDTTSVMFDGRLLGRGINNLYYNVDNCGSYIAPFLGAGIGFSMHHIRNFYSQFAPTAATTPHDATSSIGPSSTRKTAFTYQLEAGMEYKFKEKWGITVGYRWFDAGKFKTPSHTLVGTPLMGVGTSPWSGKLRAHEVFAEVAYYF